ncbi:uncharacterized protein PV09_05853 [Verruconis gallopava]|uniref:RecF/RecN/SMC N-terminal domain-containing protein n=1 Tax=Verruconis gallopava TaxID=253628 RepID=A0A0D1YQA4_9PEZI|nr:uncharacterized protein PV09_05853 [Verruconis gallopava]KIW02792.1 hypothetical protein PV09_05853 [Verruconis gallopava]
MDASALPTQPQFWLKPTIKLATMPGLKRARSRQDTEDNEVETASSHLRLTNKGRKRSRLTPVNERASDESSGGDSPRESTAAENDSEDSDISDAEAVRRTDHLHRNGQFRENHAADNGIIEEVSCRNFMCHSNLTVKLGPLINFIIGHNGSGKSAVLTALQLCLGGKATSTNRGQSLKHFIKAGSDQATLQVKIKNQGDNAYQPEVYGQSIIVERTFSRSGTSGFKLKNQDGRIVSTKKSDLEDILDALALQMDNPMNVLTQDMARQFLNSSNAADKYKFFYQGTHLEQLDSDYRILAESLQLNQDQVYMMEKSAEAAKVAYEEAEKKAQLAERAATMQEQYNHFVRQMAWIQVEEEERKLASMEEDIRKQDAVIEQRVLAAQQADAQLEEHNEARDTAQQALNAVKAELASKNEERDQVKEQFDEIKGRLMEHLQQSRSIQSELKAARDNIKRLEKDIEQEKQKIASADNGRHAQKMEDIKNAEDQLITLKDEIQQRSSESASMDRDLKNARDEVEDARTALENHKASIESVEKRISAFQRERGNWMAAYSPKLSALLNAINRESRFREKPVGPMGRHIFLLKPKWADILEKQAGAALNAFVVSSKADQTILSEIMRRVDYEGRVFVTSSRPIDTSQHEPPEEYDTWMRVLRFDNDLVRNTMIINQGIDGTVLEENSERAAEMISKRIPNVKQIFAMNPVPDRHGNRWGYRFGLTSSGGESQTPIDPWKGLPRMQTDIETQIRAEQEKLVHLKGQQTAIEERQREAENKFKRASQAIAKHKRDMKSLHDQLDRQEVAIQDLKDELEADTPQRGLLEQYEQQLEDAKETEQMNINTYQDSVLEKDRLNAEQRPIKTELDKLQSEIEMLEERIKKAELRLEKAKDKCEIERRRTNQSHELVKDAEAAKTNLEKKREEQEKLVADFTEQAEQVSRRVPIDDGETVESLEAKLLRLQREQARQRDELGGDKETLILKKLEKRQYWEERQRTYSNHDEILGTLKRALDNRLDRWKKFRDLIVLRAQSSFGYLLSERQFHGTLEISHVDRTLDIKVQPDNTLKSKKGRQTKTLSGGEKSFSTICLLLALWEAMGSPVRCLDEFDVFMDQVNRDVSMGMMITAARRAVSRQFILITPQSMNNVKLGDDVKIHKMSDPERGQTTLTQFIST